MTRINIVLYFLLLLLSSSLVESKRVALWRSPSSVPAQSLNEFFDQQQEFPNFFLPEEYRQREYASIPLRVLVDSKAELTKALSSVFDRILIPIIDEETGKLKQERYFPYALSRLKMIDPHVQLIPSGGVVRSAIGYIYDQLYHGKTLEQVVADKSDIPNLEVRGVGSDFDVYIHSTKGEFSVLQKELFQITNSVAEKYGMGENKSLFKKILKKIRLEVLRVSNIDLSNLRAAKETNAIKRTLFVISDVRDFYQHWERSVRQGGVELDWLGFDYSRKIFLEPPGHLDTIYKLIAGEYRYLPPELGFKAEDSPKHTIRGFRPMLELPWLKLNDASRLASEVDQMIVNAQKGIYPSSKTLEQFSKLIRNGRYFGAHNRFYRAPLGSIERKFLELSELLSGPQQILLPEFVGSYKRSSSTLKIPQKFLLEYESFVKERTNNGVLYYATPFLDNATAITRGEILNSQEGSLDGDYGKGAYSFYKEQNAFEYAGAKGLIIPFEVLPTANILDWSSFKESDLGHQLLEEAERQNVDVFEMLAKKYGIDIVVDKYVLIENTNAIKLPKGAQGIIDSMIKQISNKAISDKDRELLYQKLQSVLSYAVDSGLIHNPQSDEFLQTEALNMSRTNSFGCGVLATFFLRR